MVIKFSFMMTSWVHFVDNIGMSAYAYAFIIINSYESLNANLRLILLTRSSKWKPNA